MHRPLPKLVLPAVLVGALVVLAGLAGCRTKTIDLTANVSHPGVTFAADVQPILSSSCGGGQCHIQQSTSGVQLTSKETVLNSEGTQYGTLIVEPGDASRSASPLVDKILPGPTHGQQMPLNGSPLTQSEIATIRSWIEELPSTD